MERGIDNMKYNFDEIIDRTQHSSRKWAKLEEDYGDNNILPMWIADMDFRSANEIIQAFKDRVDHGIFGYGYKKDSFYDSIINWIKTRYNWHIKKEWILFTPGVVVGLNIAIRELVKEGEKVLVQPPVYPPFYRVLEKNGRIASHNPLTYNGEKFVIDYDGLESTIDKETKMLMLCNPHNPVGRVWSKEELTKLGDICLKNDITIVSDEIHCDLTLKGYNHIPLASLSTELEQNTITLMAPSKTFNIAGLVTAIAIIPNTELRNIYTKAIEDMEIDNDSIFGTLGLEVSYNHGGQWLEEVMVYIEDNIDYAIDYIKKNIPEIKVDRPEGTYLLWLDFRSLKKSQKLINESLIKTGKILLSDGSSYGENGNGFFRLNIAYPRAMLRDGLKRIEKTIKNL